MARLADRLNDYWDMVLGKASHRTALDPDLAATVGKVHAAPKGPAPDPTFRQVLWQRLLSQVNEAPAPTEKASRQRLPALAHLSRRWVAASAFVALLGLALVAFGVYVWAGRSETVSAAEIMDRAGGVAADISSTGVHSFEIQQTTTTALGGQVRWEAHIWHEAPNKWRYELLSTPLSGQEPDSAPSATVADGETIWSYDPVQNSVQISSGELPGKEGASLFGGGGDLESVLSREKTCFDPVLRGEETVAGREVYVVDLGSTKCPSASNPEVNGPRTIWADRETFFVLKDVLRSLDGQQAVYTREVTTIRYNVDLPDELFTFTPPPGATIVDTRPGLAPGATETPSTLAEIRQRSPFPIFVPTWVPEGLTPEALVGNQIRYHYADGSVGLRVTSGPAGSGLASDPRKTGESVSLPGGITAHLLAMPPQYGGPILWWDQDGTNIALSGPKLTREELVRMANSMSSTADLGPTEPPSPTPTTTPVPPPDFVILRPAWLPEQMTVREQYLPSPSGTGSMVVLRFDPRPDDPELHEVLTLTEAGLGAFPVKSNDPQATVETIGGREVTIVRRGDACVTFVWQQGDVALNLMNPYDRPGQPRYMCDQLRQIMASIR